MQSDYKNLTAPFFIFILPIILFIILKKSNKISDNFFPNKISFIVLFTLILWAYLSIRLFPQNFNGFKNVDGSEPKYQGNGFLYWFVSVLVIIIICLKCKEFPRKIAENFIPIIFTFSIFGLLFVLYLYHKDKNNYWDKDNDQKK